MSIIERNLHLKLENIYQMLNSDVIILNMVHRGTLIAITVNVVSQENNYRIHGIKEEIYFEENVEFLLLEEM